LSAREPSLRNARQGKKKSIGGGQTSGGSSAQKRTLGVFISIEKDKDWPKIGPQSGEQSKGIVDEDKQGVKSKKAF